MEYHTRIRPWHRPLSVFTFPSHWNLSGKYVLFMFYNIFFFLIVTSPVTCITISHLQCHGYWLPVLLAFMNIFLPPSYQSCVVPFVKSWVSKGSFCDIRTTLCLPYQKWMYSLWQPTLKDWSPTGPAETAALFVWCVYKRTFVKPSALCSVLTVTHNRTHIPRVSVRV